MPDPSNMSNTTQQVEYITGLLAQLGQDYANVRQAQIAADASAAERAQAAAEARAIQAQQAQLQATLRGLQGGSSSQSFLSGTTTLPLVGDVPTPVVVIGAAGVAYLVYRWLSKPKRRYRR